DDDRCLAIVDAKPLVDALTLGQRAMKNGGLSLKAPRETFFQLWREPAFRNQDQRNFCAREEMLRRSHVKFSLAAASETLEEHGLKARHVSDGVQRVGLVGGQIRPRRKRTSATFPQRARALTP